MKPVFPFSAIVGQDEMRQALLVAAVDPTVGGVLVFGDRGTGKSTAIRSLASLLPAIETLAGCRFNCAPGEASVGAQSCPDCTAKGHATREMRAVAVVDLPLGATEDRIVGALDLERALTRGEKVFEPGLLARAHRGFLYIDEVNLLEDHLVDLLLDVSASGENVVEREGLSIRHPSRFVLVGSGNPEEGDLRPQLLDRFGLSVEVRTPTDVATRVEVVRRRDAFERDPAAFVERWRTADEAVRDQILAARERIRRLDVADVILQHAAALCIALGTDGMRGELTLLRTARALAALDGADEVQHAHLKQSATMALRHRLRRDPLDETGSTVRVERALAELYAPRLERLTG
ncbi:MAG: magnesium chelatase ATPase subunit I [Hyphomicrobiaceae bacterium]